jgi:energy-coupling factor transport system permease protein
MLFLYVDRASAVHALHPVAKVLGLLCLFVAAFVADRPVTLLPLLGGVLALGAAAGVLSVLWRLRLLFVVIFLVTVSTWSFFYAEPLRFSAPGLTYGLSMGFRLMTFFACGMVFLGTTKVEELAAALHALRVPYYFGFTLTLAVRLVPVFFGAALTVREAQRCRGLDFGHGSLATRIAHHARLIVPVFLGALRRADRMAMALEVRGFNSGRPRTIFPGRPFRSSDAVALAAAVGLAALYLWLWSTGLTQLAT